MASNFKIISNKFYNQIRNGINFSANLGEFATSVKSNAGDVIKLVQTIELGVIFNSDETSLVTVNTMPWDALISEIDAPSIDWISGGFYPSAVIRVERGGIGGNITIVNITGVGNSKLIISSADMTSIILALGLTDGEEYSDLIFKLISVPSHCIFKYKLNPSDLGTPTYVSPLDLNEQSYYVNDLDTSLVAQNMIFLGGMEGSNMATVDIKFVSTLDNYLHRFEINNTFKNPYYVAGQLTNIESATNPDDLIGDSTLRYDNYFEMGTPAYHSSIFNNIGLTGDCGYFNENFNGKINNYTVENVVITNPDSTGKLESTKTNSLSFDVTTTGTWNAGEGAVLAHSKLPTLSEYQLKTDDYDDVWIFDNIYNDESAAPVSSGIFTNFQFSIVAANKITVTVDIDFSAAQKLRILDTSYYGLWFQVANVDLSNPDLIDRVSLVVDVDTYTKNTDVDNLITAYDPEFREEFRGLSGVNYTNFAGGDGDLWTMKFQFSTDTVRGAQILSAKFKIIAENLSDPLDTFEVGNSTVFPLGIPIVTTDGTYIYQIINIDSINLLNLPDDAILKKLDVTMNVPASLPSTTQDVEFITGFQVPWRDWIENLNVPISLYDVTKPQNNRNNKTSNYSGLSSYNIYGVLELSIFNTVETTPTIYQLYSDSSNIIDFDAAGWIGFNGDVKLYDEDGLEVTELEDDRDLIVKVECVHGSGTLSPQTIACFVWIEIDGSTATPSYLSSSYDYTSSDNRLQPSDELLTGNTQYVEMLSELNKVTLICKTNSSNLIANLGYLIKGRLWHKI